MNNSKLKHECLDKIFTSPKDKVPSIFVEGFILNNKDDNPSVVIIQQQGINQKINLAICIDGIEKDNYSHYLLLKASNDVENIKINQTSAYISSYSLDENIGNKIYDEFYKIVTESSNKNTKKITIQFFVHDVANNTLKYTKSTAQAAKNERSFWKKTLPANTTESYNRTSTTKAIELHK